MLEWLRRSVRDLTGRAGRDLLGHLHGQLLATLDGVEVASRLAVGDLDPDRARDEVVAAEHRGDEARAALVGALATTLTTPLDREDLFRLSRSVDDVLDNVRDLVREADLYGVGAEPLLVDPLAEIRRGVAALADAVDLLVHDPDRLDRGTAAAKGTDVRRCYQQAVAELLTDDAPLDRRTLARRELLRRVDVIGLRLVEAADALADAAVKRSL